MKALQAMTGSRRPPAGGETGSRVAAVGNDVGMCRILDPASKLATARALSPATASSSLGEILGLSEVDDDPDATDCS